MSDESLRQRARALHNEAGFDAESGELARAREKLLVAADAFLEIAGARGRVGDCYAKRRAKVENLYAYSEACGLLEMAETLEQIEEARRRGYDARARFGWDWFAWLEPYPNNSAYMLVRAPYGHVSTSGSRRRQWVTIGAVRVAGDEKRVGFLDIAPPGVRTDPYKRRTLLQAVAADVPRLLPVWSSPQQRDARRGARRSRA